MAIPDPIWLYHITHISNLQGLLRSGGLLANNQLVQSGTAYTNIANQNIQTRRHTTRVPCGPGGLLHDYVPFYFGARSPMLYAIHGGYVDGYEGGQQEVVYLVARFTDVVAAGCDWVFTNGHAAMYLSDFFEDAIHFNEVDWPLMQAQYWYDTNDDPDRKRRRQAEFLVKDRVPWQAVAGVVTFDELRAQQAQAILDAEGPLHRPSIQAVRGWYY